MLHSRFSLFVILFSFLFINGASAHQNKPLPHPEDCPQIAASVDVALLLDTSNSMDGLISQAKSQLWTIVQQFARAEKHGLSPRLRVALFEYGNTNLPVSEGYLRQVVPLGDDLDVLSEALFALRTRGGDEYCGMVIDEALTRLDWSDKPGSYKAIFIAGNEPFTQGPVDHHAACHRSCEKGVLINTIHCGNRHEGVDGGWLRGAELGHGKFFNIDQDRAIVHIRCPQDDQIMRLNEELNGTYLWYGSQEKREYFFSNQKIQDSNAGLLSSSVAVSRSVTKSSKVYNNSGRDLVDAMVDDENILEKVPEDELPDNIRALSPEERAEFLEEMTAKRADLKAKIGKLAVEREAFLAAEQLKQADETGGTTLGDAVVQAIRKQLVDGGFVIQESPGQ